MKEEMDGKTMLVISREDLMEFGRKILSDFAEQFVKDPKPDAYTPKQVEEICHVSHSHLWHLEKRGILIPTRIGRKKWYKREDVERLMTGRV